MSDKITSHHRARKAILYIRQSSAHQVQHNLESQRLQYAMRDRLQQLWYWCRKLSDEPRPEVADASACVRVRVAGDPPTPVLEIVLNTGDRLHVSAGATADLVQAVVTALRSRC